MENTIFLLAKVEVQPQPNGELMEFLKGLPDAGGWVK